MCSYVSWGFVFVLCVVYDVFMFCVYLEFIETILYSSYIDDQALWFLCLRDLLLSLESISSYAAAECIIT